MLPLLVAVPGPRTEVVRERRPDPVKRLAAGWAVRWFGLSAYAPYVLIYLNSNLRLPYLLAGFLLALPNLVGLAFPLLGGGLADRFGRRTVLVSSFALETLGLAVLAAGAFAGSLWTVVSGLVLARASGTLGSPAVSAYVTDLTDRARRAESQAWMRTALNIGFTGGTLAGGASLAVLSFGQLAGLTAGITAVGVILTVLFVPPTPFDARDSAVRRPGTPLLPGLASAFAASVRALRRDRTLLLLWGATCATWTLNQQIGYAVPAYAHSTLGLPFAVVGALLTANAAIVVLAQVPLTRWISGRSMTRLGSLGALAYAVSFVGLGIEGSLRFQIEGVLLGMIVLMTVGECTVFYPASTLSMNLAPSESRGAYSGAMNASSGVGAVLAPLLAGLALGAAVSPWEAWATLALPAVPAVALLLLVRRRVRQDLDRC